MNRKAMEQRRQKGLPVHVYSDHDDHESPPAKVDPKEEARLRINHASAANHIAEVQAILHKDPNAIHTADANGWQPLHEAVRGGHTELVRFLVANGSDLGAVTNRGGTALWWARRSLPPGHSTISFLMEMGAPEHAEQGMVL